MTAASLWLLLFCADGCYLGVWTEGPKDWERQGFCKPGHCDTGATCDFARREYLDKALKAKRGANAFCAYEGK